MDLEILNIGNSLMLSEAEEAFLTAAQNYHFLKKEADLRNTSGFLEGGKKRERENSRNALRETKSICFLFCCPKVKII